MSNATRISQRRSRPSPKHRPAFLLLLVLLVVAMASLAMLNFSHSMLNSNEASQLSNARFKARMCAESGAQAVRLFLAYPQMTRQEMGGTWSNPMFYARNVLPDTDPRRRGNYTILAPAQDEMGNYAGVRYGLQNESAKLNLNALAQLDSLASSDDLGGGSGSGESEEDDLQSQLASTATSEMSAGVASSLLMALPGMTQETADAILDWMDEDSEPREMGAEADYYSQMQPPYTPANGRLSSIESLLLVRGITPQLLFGYDENRNGVLDPSEQSKMASGVQPGAAPGAMPTTALDPTASPPPPLGWAAYLTLHSQESPMSSDGMPRIDINSSDLELLYDDLVEVLGDETWASFIVAYRVSGQAGGGGSSPLETLASMATAGISGAGQQSDLIEADFAVADSNSSELEDAEPWTVDALDEIDLSQGGNVQFNQVLDLYDATVTLGEGDDAVTFRSPFTSDPLSLSDSSPFLLDYLTTIGDSPIPGRINIMECPREILLGIPGLDVETAEQILVARNDGSDSPTRGFPTWLVAEGLLSMEQLRAIYPLVTCGGDVYKAQIVGYIEGNASFSRIETIVSGAGQVPRILFFRRLDHLTRGFDIATLGQRPDSGSAGQMMGGMGTGGVGAGGTGAGGMGGGFGMPMQ